MGLGDFEADFVEASSCTAPLLRGRRRIGRRALRPFRARKRGLFELGHFLGESVDFVLALEDGVAVAFGLTATEDAIGKEEFTRSR